MNLPNKITIVRVAMIPFFILILMWDAIPFDMQIRRYIAVVLFSAASISDGLDGYIARKYRLITNFGKFMDPLADKLLVCSALIALIGLEGSVVNLPSWCVIIIIAREFIITGFRTIAIEQNIVIAAGWWGKIKTTVQMIMIISLLLNINHIIFKWISIILIALSVILTVISAADYILKNKGVFSGDI